MKNIKDLEKQYNDLRKNMHDLSNIIIQHLHDVFDEKLDHYDNWDDFLEDINSYAGDTFGKLMYINFAKNTKKFVG